MTKQKQIEQYPHHLLTYYQANTKTLQRIKDSEHSLTTGEKYILPIVLRNNKCFRGYAQTNQ